MAILPGSTGAGERWVGAQRSGACVQAGRSRRHVLNGHFFGRYKVEVDVRKSADIVVVGGGGGGS
eukprot:scaffold21372_cov48-Phaeocystis_antarctica.AAC.2